MATVTLLGRDELSEDRMRAAVRVAGEMRTGIDSEALTALLPEGGFADRTAVSNWFRAHPEEGSVSGQLVFASGLDVGLSGLHERRNRGLLYLEGATELIGETLDPMSPLFACVGVTGSAAYGEPELGDDCDFFAVVRPSTVWVFLTYLYLRLRLAPPLPRPGRPPAWCFNYVLDERVAPGEFALPRGFHIAREALSARILRGATYYNCLIGRAGWMKTEAPRLYSRWDVGATRGMPCVRRSPWPLRVLNGALFLLVGSYLQAVGLLRNHRLRREGRDTESFRTVTSLRKLAVLSDKFDRLSQIYQPSTELSPGSSPT